MADEAGVLDAGLDLDSGFDAPETTTEPAGAADRPSVDRPSEEKPTADEFKDDKSFRDALKAWRDLNKDNPEIVKHARRAYNLNGQFSELSKLDPKGLSGVRDTYALISSAGGPEKITELQTFSQERQAQDALWQAGDPKALDNIPPEWNQGLAKLAPQYLDRIQKADPAAYANAILPHLMSNLVGSPLVSMLNELVDDFTGRPGRPALDDKGKAEAAQHTLANIAQWFAKEQQRAGALKTAPGASPQADEFQAQRTQFEKEKQDHFWNTQINPSIVAHEKAEVDKALVPYLGKLRLDEAAKADLTQAIRGKIGQLFKADTVAWQQYQNYKASKSPDTQRVTQFLKNSASKYIKEAVDSSVKSRYGFVLSSRPGPKTGTGAPGGSAPAPTGKGSKSNPILVPTKPSQDSINWGLTKRAGDYLTHTYVLNDGRTVRWNRK